MSKKGKIIKNDNNYICDIKIDNFTNNLNSLVKTLITLDLNFKDSGLFTSSAQDKNRKELLNSIHIGEDLSKQFTIIQEKFLTNEVANKIEKVNKKYKEKKQYFIDKVVEADEKINDLEKKNKLECERSINAINNYDIAFQKNESYQTQLNNLETVIGSKNIEISKLSTKLQSMIDEKCTKNKNENSEVDNEVDNEDTEQLNTNKNVSVVYLNTLNDGNSKIIQFKTQKIQKLEEELVESLSKNKELEILCIKLEKDIMEISQDIINSTKKTTSFQDEIANLDKFNTIRIPLLESEYIAHENKECKFCCIL